MDKKTTVITMFFNLKNLKDTSKETRPIDFYIQNGKLTLQLQYPMVIFCDEDTQPILKEIRDTYVDSDIIKTIYIVKKLTDYDFYIHNYSIVSENRRKSNGYKNPEDRNTVSYFLLMLLKAYSISISKQRNDFNTEFYAWVDFGCSHICRKFTEYSVKMLDNPNPKVSCCYIHYRSSSELSNMKEYMEYGGKCGVAATAFTVHKDYADKFKNAMFSIFNEMLYRGYGHSDETLMTYCYDRFPELFTIYYGDYYSILTNYHEPQEDLNSIKQFFIYEALNKNRPDLANHAICAIIDSLSKKTTNSEYELLLLDELRSLESRIKV